MKLRMFLLALMMFRVAGPAFADERQLQEFLQKALNGKLVCLRKPYASTNLKFDRTGNLLGAAQNTSWTMNGVVLVKNIQLKKSSLRLDGKRVILILGQTANNQLTPLITDQSIRLTVEDTTGINDQQTMYEVLSRIFTTDKVEERFTTYWKPLVDLDTSLDEIKRLSPDGLIGTLDSKRPVYRVLAGAVSPPKPLHTPDPDYPQNAREKRLPGTSHVRMVLSQDGFPEIVKLDKDLDRDFDIAAVMALSQWSFQPAMRAGVPVSVLIDVEFRFSIH